MVLDVKNFLLEKFWIPIIDESVYYNPYNTFVYALLFGLLAIYVVYPAVKKMDIQIDRKFFIAFLPFVVFGGALRALKDIGATESVFLVTPFIYLVIGGIGISALFLSREIEKRGDISYHKTLSLTSIVLLLLSLSFYSLENFEALLLETFIVLLWISIGFLALKVFRPDLLRFEFTAPVSAHYLDASSTFTALSFGASEKHVLGRTFIEFFGPSGIFLMKTIVIIPVSYYLVTEFEGEEKMFYIFLITALGLGIATRNTLQTIGV
jgi:uncharacterized membrane protein